MSTADNKKTQTPSADMNRKQLILIGGGKDLATDFQAALDSEDYFLHVKGESWKSASWQRTRFPGESWAVVALERGGEIDPQELVECVKLVRLSFRPTRLVVLLKSFSMKPILAVARAGADGALPADADSGQIWSELEGPGVEVAEYFPDPEIWLQSLRRASMEMDLSAERGIQLKKLLRIFVSQLGVERASIMLLEGDRLRLAAAIGLPENADRQETIELRPGSITDWVIQNRRPRLVLGEVAGSRPLAKGVQSAVCSPIIVKGSVLGAVSFSSSEGRALNQMDLSTTEVFASHLGMAISNQRLMEDNIEAERLAAIGSTMATVSHCLKNLLTIFKGSVSIMQRALEKDDLSLAANAYNLIRNGTRRIENLVLDLLDMSKQREPEYTETDPCDMLDEIQEVFNPESQQKKFGFEIKCRVDGRYLLDSFRLQRALLNLLSNSLDAIPAEGKIRLSVSREEDLLNFQVEDNGPGVEKEKLESIFDPFYSTKGSSGTGLGLAMVQKFCEENNGSAEVANDSNLGGLRFSIKLPIYNPENETAED